MDLIKHQTNEKLSNFIVFIMIYVSTETLLFGTNNNNMFLYFHYAVIIALFVFLLFLFLKKNKKIAFDRKTFSAYSALCFLSLITMLINKDVSFHYIYEIILLSIALLYTKIFSFDVFKKSFIKIILFLVKCSFLTFLLDLFFPQVLNFFPTLINKANIRFHFWPFGCAMYKTMYEPVRNWSIFREPGVFAIFIVLAILFILLSCDKIKKNNSKDLFLLFLGLFTTFSTGGIISGVLLIVLYLLRDKINFRKFILAIIVIVSLFFLHNYTNFFHKVFGKLFTQNASMISRSASIYSNLKVFSISPIFGIGFGKLDLFFQYFTVEKFNAIISKSYANTNTFFRMLSTHGLFFFAIYFIGYYKFFVKNSKNRFTALLLYLILLLAFSNENLMLNIVFPILLFYGYNIKSMC